MAMKAIRTIIGLLALMAAAFAGGYLYKADKGGAARSSHKDGHKILYWVDPMHPAYKSDKPGIAPDCGMKLVPVYAEDSRKSLFRDAAGPSGSVTVDPDTRHLAGIQLTTVEKSTEQSVVKVFGRV